MSKSKNFFYRINPNEVLGEVIFVENKEKWFLQFFNDLRKDDPETAVTDMAKGIILEAHGFREKRSKAGKASAEQRAIKEQQEATYVEHMLEDVEHEINTTQPVAIAVAVTEAIPKKESKPKPVAVLPEWLPLDAWQGYVEMRVKIRKPMTPYASELRIKDLDKLKAEGHDPAGVLNQSTANSWTDLYPIKENGNDRPRTAGSTGQTGRKTGLVEANGVGTDFLS